MDTEALRKLIGSRIALARKAKGLKQNDLATALGVHKQTVSRWETGARTPNGEEIRQIVETCGCTADFLLGFSDTLNVGEDANE